MKKFLLSLLTVFAATSAFAAETVETLTTGGFWPNNSSYLETKTSEDEFLSTTWKAVSFNNNNNNASWGDIRCGRKGNASVASIYNDNALSVAVSKIVVNTQYIKTADIGKINSVTLYVSKNSSFSESTTTTISYANYNTDGDWAFEIPSDVIGVGQFYKLVIDCASAGNNGFLAIKTLNFTTVTTVDFPNPFESAYELVKGTTKAIAIDDNAPAFTSTSTDESVAVFDITTNEIKALNTGDATITVNWNETEKWNAGSASFKVSVSAEGVTEATILIEPTNYSVMAGETLSVDYLYDGDGELSVTSSDESIATAEIKDDVIIITPITRGKVTFTVSAEKTDNYTSAKATFTVEVKTVEYSQTINFQSLNLDKNTVLTEYEVGSVDFEFATAGGSTDPAYYTSGASARVYTGNTLTISVPNGYLLLSVEFTITQGSVSGNFSSGDYDSTSKTWNVGKDTNIVRYTHSGSQVRFSNIKVTYTKASNLKGEIYEPAAFNDFMISLGDELALDLGENHPEIRYTFEGDKISIDNNVVTTKKAGSVKVIAAWDAVEGEWIAGSEKFTVYVKYPTLADVLKDAQNPEDGFVRKGEVYVGNFDVTIVSENGNYNYVTDGTAWALFYVGHDHEDGDVIPAGWSGIFTNEYGVPEFNNIKHDEIEQKATVELEEVNEDAITSERVNQVLVMNDVNVTSATPAGETEFFGTFAGKQYQFVNRFKLASIEAGTYNIKVAVSLEDGEVVLFPIEFYTQEKTANPSHNETNKYNNGDAVVFNHEEGAHIYYRHGEYTQDGVFNIEDPDHTNVFTEAPQSAPMKVVPDVDFENTYNHTTHPLTFNGDVINVKYMAKAPGKAPSDVQLLQINDEGGDTTGIEAIAVDAVNGEVEYFNLQGQRVENPAAGLYIMRQGSKVQKVLVK